MLIDKQSLFPAPHATRRLFTIQAKKGERKHAPRSDRDVKLVSKAIKGVITAAHNLKPKMPLWITEVGFPVANRPSTPTTPASPGSTLTARSIAPLGRKVRSRSPAKMPRSPGTGGSSSAPPATPPGPMPTPTPTPGSRVCFPTVSQTFPSASAAAPTPTSVAATTTDRRWPWLRTARSC